MTVSMALLLAADVEWLSTFDEAADKARASGRPIVLALDASNAGC
jgi:hypothetical protein